MATIINAATPNTSAGPATSTVALNTTGGSGTCFLGFVMSRSPNITPSDTFGNTWTPLIAEQTVTLNSIDYFCRVWICVGGTGGNNHQFTATNDASGALDFITAHFIELVGDVVGLDEVSDWVVDGTADYESDVLDPSAPNALIFAFNQIFSTTAGSSFTHGDDGFADVASAYLNGVNGPVGEIRYQFGGAPDSYQTIITATNPSPRDVGAFLFSIELASGVPVARSVGLAAETDTALGLAAAKSRPAGLAQESDAALGLAAAKARTAGLAAETDAALALGRGKARTVGLAIEGDLALALAPAKARAAGLAAEADTALGLAAAKSRPAGLASETDTAFSLSQPGEIIAPVGRADETDTALAPAHAKARGVGLAVSLEQALALAPIKLRSVGLAVENDIALRPGALSIPEGAFLRFVARAPGSRFAARVSASAYTARKDF
jgi:hypothetical protein